MYMNYYGYLNSRFLLNSLISGSSIAVSTVFIPMEAFYVSIYSIVDRMGE